MATEEPIHAPSAELHLHGGLDRTALSDDNDSVSSSSSSSSVYEAMQPDVLDFVEDRLDHESDRDDVSLNSQPLDDYTHLAHGHHHDHHDHEEHHSNPLDASYTAKDTHDFEKDHDDDLSSIDSQSSLHDDPATPSKNVMDTYHPQDTTKDVQKAPSVHSLSSIEETPRIVAEATPESMPTTPNDDENDHKKHFEHDMVMAHAHPHDLGPLDEEIEKDMDDDYDALVYNRSTGSTSPSPSVDQTARRPSSQRSTLRLSHVAPSELNEVSLDDVASASSPDDAKPAASFFQSARSTVSTMTTKMSRAMSISSVSSQNSTGYQNGGGASIMQPSFSTTTSAMTANSSTTSNASSSMASQKELPPMPRIDTSVSKKPGPIDTALATLTASASTPTSTPTQRFVSNLWSPFKANGGGANSPKPIERPSANFAERQRRQSRPPSIALPGFQESLLAQMEQLNQANTDDPKARRVMQMKRKSLRRSIVQRATHKDGFDWDYWATVLTDFDRMGKNRYALTQQIRRGVPPPLRGTLWQLLSQSHEGSVLPADTNYVDLLKQTSPYDKMIQRDLARTFPDHAYFKDPAGEGQEGLYNVVRAYSVFDGRVGYCQGLQFIVGPLLLNMADADAFLVLVQLMNSYGMRGHFTPDMEGLHLRMYQFDKVLMEHLPHVWGHLQRRGIDVTMYASQWFMTLYAYKFPLDLVFRIYDLVFVEGVQVVLKFALALLKRNEVYLLQLDFEPLLDFLKNGLFETYKGEEAQLVHDAMTWDLPKRRLAQLEKEHKQQMARDEQEAKQLQALQQEQARLKQMVQDKQQRHDHMAQEQQELHGQLRASQWQLDHIKEEQVTLRTVTDTLRHEIDILPLRVEEEHKEKFDALCSENTRLNQHNAHLEDQLAQLEASLIDFKMRYAESETDCTQLSKRLYELKKIIDQ